MKLKLFPIIIIHFKADKKRAIGCHFIFDWLTFAACTRTLVSKPGGGQLGGGVLAHLPLNFFAMQR